MVVPQLLVIHNLTQKLIELQGTVQLQRKVDSEMSSAIRRQLADIQEGLTQFSKDSSELLRLLQCCCCFLAEGIRGKSIVYTGTPPPLIKATSITFMEVVFFSGVEGFSRNFNWVAFII